MPTSPFPPLTAKPSDKRCTNCSSIMSLYSLPAHYGQAIDIDVCLDCNAIWFDQWESSQLSPDGVVALFQLINERGGTSSSAGAKLNEGLRCVSCGEGMKLVNDRVKNTRFVYQSCRQGHGRFTTFYNFLSEKQFVRELTQAERAKLSATVRQIKCSGCAAPVDLAKSDACQYCRAPVSVFDRDAAKQAIDHYLRERKQQIPASPPQNYGYSQRQHQRDWDTWDTIYAADIATDLLWGLGRAASRGLTRAAPAGAIGAGAGSVLADAGNSGVSSATGGLLGSASDALTQSGAPLATATDVLFGSAGSLADGASLLTGNASLLSENASLLAADSATQVFGNANMADALPSATDALFGGGSASDLFANAGNAASDVSDGLASAVGSSAGDVFDSVSDSVSDSVGELAGDVAGDIASSGGDFVSSAGEGVVDLVSDGIGSLIGSIFS
jgi:hypothetical protein